MNSSTNRKRRTNPCSQDVSVDVSDPGDDVSARRLIVPMQFGDGSLEHMCTGTKSLTAAKRFSQWGVAQALYRLAGLNATRQRRASRLECLLLTRPPGS